jgi:hypothetical protein
VRFFAFGVSASARRGFNFVAQRGVAAAHRLAEFHRKLGQQILLTDIAAGFADLMQQRFGEGEVLE